MGQFSPLDVVDLYLTHTLNRYSEHQLKNISQRRSSRRLDMEAFMHSPKSFFNSIFLLLFVYGLSGCGAGNGQSSDESSSSTSAVNSSSSSSDANIACSTTELPSTPLRRLTRFEYENTVRDLLGVNTDAVHQIPADEADGFDNNAALQVAPDFLVEKYVVVSEALAAEAVENVTELTNCNAQQSGEENCARQFAQTFGRRAFRRPLTDADETMFMAAYAAGAEGGTHAEGIEVMIRFALQSPNFLYRLEITPSNDPSQQMVPVSPFELATRLAYFIWGTAPDEALLDAAAAGQLASKEQVASKAREMLASPKAQVSLSNFLEQWSGLRKLEILTKNTTLYPNYSNEVRDAMKRELPAFLDYLFANDDVTLRSLFTSNLAFVSGPLAEIYGVASPPGSSTTARMVELPEEQERAGLLTQAGFLSVQGHPDQTSPVLRGKFVRSNLLCNPPPPPPDDLDISVPELTDGTTARDRAEVHLSAGGSCNGCHVLMDPIGLAFEHFDAMGQHRLYEGGSTIDVSGEVIRGGDPVLDGPFVGVRELADKLVESEVVQDCVASQMFRFASGRYEDEGDSCSITTMQDAFSAADGDMVELIVAMTQTDAFLFRTKESQP